MERRDLGHRLRRIGWSFGLDVRPFVAMRDPMLRLCGLLEYLNISLLVDVGAHRGEWASDVRRAGFGGRIASFEPHPVEYRLLAARASHDPSWQTHNIALGDTTGTTALRLTAQTEFSSILAPAAGRPLAQTASDLTHPIETRRLDEILTDERGERLFIKADVQGYELRVLSGMDGLGASVVGGQIEVNLRPLYEGQPSLQDALSALEERGFRIAGVANGGFEPSGEESYIDIMFVRV